MNISIYATDENKKNSRGAGLRLRSDEISVYTLCDEVRIEAREVSYYGSGERGGKERKIRRRVSIWLDKSDIKKIMECLIEQALLEDEEEEV
jgi:hypothetical protein